MQYPDSCSKRVIVGFVDNKAFNGENWTRNLKNYRRNFFSLYADGMQIPNRPLQPNFSKDEPLYVEAYGITHYSRESAFTFWMRVIL